MLKALGSNIKCWILFVKMRNVSFHKVKGYAMLYAYSVSHRSLCIEEKILIKKMVLSNGNVSNKSFPNFFSLCLYYLYRSTPETMWVWGNWKGVLLMKLTLGYHFLYLLYLKIATYKDIWLALEKSFITSICLRSYTSHLVDRRVACKYL